MPSSLIEGPDFICVGMIKAGTGWLFDQVQHHPDFWMPPVKEIRYFGTRDPQLRIVKERLKRWRKLKNRSADQHRSLDERAYQFLRDANELSGQPLDFQRYVALFRHKEARFSGDVSPVYSRLTDETITAVAQNLAKAKIILLVREPVARAWSGISMLYRQGKFDRSLLDDADRFREYYRSSNKTDRRSSPSKLYLRWQQCAPQMQFRYFFFDDIASQPEKVRRDILVYIGADPEKRSGELSADYNRKANKEKLELAEPIKAVLVDHFEDELRACAELFGGHAVEWAKRYGL